MLKEYYQGSLKGAIIKEEKKKATPVAAPKAAAKQESNKWVSWIWS